MKHLKLTHVVLCLLLSLIGVSCNDDLLYDDSGRPIEGLPATIKVKVDLSDMPHLTRAIIDDAEANYCDNLWVGIYRVSDGKCLYNHLYTDVVNNLEEVGARYGLGTLTISTESGRSRIVAVANVNSCQALSDLSSSDSEARPLGEVLAEADTWDVFKNISVLRSQPDDIFQMSYDLTLSGYYCEDGQNSALTYDKMPTVDIVEGDNNLEGAINLRHLISYNKFNITAGSNIDLDVKSWQVFNNPYMCYVLEAPTNAGDDYTGSTQVYNSSIEMTNMEYDNDVVSFDFYQLENKHTACDYDGKSDWVGIRDDSGLSAADMYNDREREYKDSYSDIQRTTPDDNGTYHINTGVYKSLVDKVGDSKSMANNNASYVVIKADISYYFEDTPENRANPDTAVPEAKGASAKQILRTAQTTYVVHLGYCEGKNGSTPTHDTAMDFNCRRNSKYTYNITINGVNSIVVEANKNDEAQSGAEGTVFDSYGEYVELDSHYCTFNISLSNEERKSLRYHIIAPYDGTNNYIYSENLTDADKAQLDNNKFYTWVKFKPTSDENTLATYKTSTTDNTQWSLEDLKDVAHHAGNNGSTSESDTTQQWYTVFIDEYVYHEGESGSETTGYEETSWGKYTNQDDRKVEFVVTDNQSSDSESTYLLCKYAFSQKSIQTYYRSMEVGETGLGVEHSNESFCLNFRWHTLVPVGSDLVDTEGNKHVWNGRYNLWYAITQVATGFNWANTVDQTLPDHIDAGSSKEGKYEHDAADYPVPQLAKITETSMIKGGNQSYGLDPSQNDPNYYFINTACMNRNRDLDGDGEIDVNEMRWYLPTYNQYAEIMIGLKGLVDPIFEWNRYSKYLFLDKGLTTSQRNFSHFAGSDANYMWADEGMSRGGFESYTSTGGFPYELRCVRNLGLNPGVAPQNTSSPDYQQAFTYDADTRIISAEYYTDECIRPYTTDALAPHGVNELANRSYRYFEVAKNISTGFNADDFYDKTGTGNLYEHKEASDYQGRINEWYHSLKKNDICGTYTQDADGSDLGKWRVPNVNELGMMTITKSISDMPNLVASGTYEYFVSYDGNECPYCYLGRIGGYIARSLLKNTSNINMCQVRCVRDVK